MTDVFLFQTPDDGDIDTTTRDIRTTAGLETAVYLSLFGGNEGDNGSEATQDEQWWGNIGLTDVEHRQTSRTQYLADSQPQVSATLVKLNQAIQQDLAWLGDAYDVTVSSSFPALNRVSITVTVGAETFEFIEDWATNDRT